MLNIVGALQELLYSAGLMMSMDYYVSSGLVHLTFIDGGLKLLEIHMRYGCNSYFFNLPFFLLFFFPLFFFVWEEGGGDGLGGYPIVNPCTSFCKFVNDKKGNAQALISGCTGFSKDF